MILYSPGKWGKDKLTTFWGDLRFASMYDKRNEREDGSGVNSGFAIFG